MSPTPISTWELYMIVKDPDLIRRLMDARIDPVTRQSARLSARGLAETMGWKSHTYAQRILRGEVHSVTSDTANKIAYLLGVPVDLLFMPKVSGNAVDSVKEKVA